MFEPSIAKDVFEATQDAVEGAVKTAMARAEERDVNPPADEATTQAAYNGWLAQTQLLQEMGFSPASLCEASNQIATSLDTARERQKV
jgi:hypothetical protein